MKIISWNVNGFRSLMNRSFLDAFTALDADVYCLQETRLQSGDGGVDIPGFMQYWHHAQRKGYAGTAIMTVKPPLEAYSGVGAEPFDSEGRVLTLDFGDFYLVNCYAPNAAPDLSRLDERIQWDAALLAFVKALDETKPVILCGDLNAAYNDADVQGKGQGMHIPGYTAQERSGLVALLQSGMTDAYRHFHPDEKAGAFAYRKGIRSVGLDYFLVSDRFMDRIRDCRVHNRIKGSDHWPLELIVKEAQA